MATLAERLLDTGRIQGFIEGYTGGFLEVMIMSGDAGISDFENCAVAIDKIEIIEDIKDLNALKIKIKSAKNVSDLIKVIETQQALEASKSNGKKSEGS